ncbi:hypothetical protein FB451DRAFT_1407530 [Mycena latifolia]|nr:hypothetical protein FB451DRAFT_1407530 [Mycena latifolia]
MISTAHPKPKGPLDDLMHHIDAALAPPHNLMPSVKGGKPMLLVADVKVEDVSPWLRWAVSPCVVLASSWRPRSRSPPPLSFPSFLTACTLPRTLSRCSSSSRTPL